MYSLYRKGSTLAICSSLRIAVYQSIFRKHTHKLTAVSACPKKCPTVYIDDTDAVAAAAVVASSLLFHLKYMTYAFPCVPF